MTNWLRRKLHNFIFPSDIAETSKPSRLVSTRHDQGLGSNNNPLRFTVYEAAGGKIVEVTQYDNRKDEHYSSLHIINSEEDFGDSVGKIIFMESLKRGR
jgi:hypothetical protein